MIKYTITKKMNQSHRMLNILLNKVVDRININKKTAGNLFTDYKKKLEDHFRIEEKAIFSFNDLEEQQNIKIIRKLYDEHNRIRLMLEQIENDLKNDNYCDLSSFLRLIENHQVLETNTLYPKIDEEITGEEKKEILKNIDIQS